MREKNDFSPASIKYALDNSYSDFKRITLICINYIGQSENQFFGQRGFKVQEDGWEDNIHAVLDTLGDFIKEGKIYWTF
jgi:hypothetical protein